MPIEDAGRIAGRGAGDMLVDENIAIAVFVEIVRVIIVSAIVSPPSPPPLWKMVWQASGCFVGLVWRREEVGVLRPRSISLECDGESSSSSRSCRRPQLENHHSVVLTLATAPNVLVASDGRADAVLGNLSVARGQRLCSEAALMSVSSG